MSALHHLRSCALLSAAFLFGCTEASAIDDANEPDLQPRNGGASGGTNGGSSNDLHALEAMVLLAANSPLVNPGTMTVHNAIVAGLLAQPGGSGMFGYAVQCGLDRHAGGRGYVMNGATRYDGFGHLTTTGGWLAGPLSPAGKDDLFACMATLMNPFGVHVKVLLSGSDIRDNEDDTSEYDFLGAAWAAHVTPSGVEYTVWPSSKFYDGCEIDPVSVFQTRVCGIAPAVCHLTLGGKLEDQCEGDASDELSCDGEKVIVTHLREEDFVTLNPACAPDAGP